MGFITVTQFAEQHNLPERTVRNWCASGKMEGAFLAGKTWNIPEDAPLPKKGKVKASPLLKRLREEKEGKVSGGIYHRTQIDLTYNSNHIEGSKLTHEQTRYIFETNTIGITDESINKVMESARALYTYLKGHCVGKQTSTWGSRPEFAVICKKARGTCPI